MDDLLATFLSWIRDNLTEDFVTGLLSWTFVLLPMLGIYSTIIHYRWWKLYKPSPLIKHLLIAALALDVAAVMVTGVAAASLLGTPLPRPYGALVVSVALYIAIGIKVWRRFDLRALDHPGEDLETRVETQDQREDRQFGEERRLLESQHNKDKTSADQEQ